MPDVRRAAVAGTWYPGTATVLAQAVDEHLAKVPDRLDARPMALIAPHAGLMYSGPVAAHAYKLVRHCQYSDVIVVGPSHFVGFRGVAVWPRGGWDTPFGRVPVAERMVSMIRDHWPEIVENRAAHEREHSLEMQLPFLARLLPDVPIVPLVMGYQTRATAVALGDALAKAVTATRRGEGLERSTLLVASSDLSHYEDARTASTLDAVVLRHVEALDADGLMDALELEPRHACGGGPIVAVLQAVKKLGASRAEVLNYADSGDVSGDKSSVVGYMAAAIW